MTIEKKAKEVTKNILCKGCENNCSIFLCNSAKSFYEGALAGIEAGRKEREDEIKQVEKNREEIQKSCANCGRYDPKKDCSELCFFEEYEKWIPAEGTK